MNATRVIHHPRLLMFAALLVCLGCSSGYGASTGTTSAPGPTPAGPAGQADLLVATCHSVDPASKTVQVITGLGLALHLETFTVGDATTITMDGQPLRLSDLDPGDVLRILYETTGGEHYAKRIDAFAVEKAGGDGQ